MATTCFEDLFTGTNGTDLTAHTPDTGTSWSVGETSSGTDTIEIQTNQARAATGTANHRVAYLAACNPALAGADYDVEAKLTVSSGTGAGVADDPFYVIGRWSTNNNYYAAAVYQGTTNLLKLYKKVGGTVTQLGSSVAYTMVANDVVKLVMVGTSIKVQINGVDQISVTDSDLTGTGTPGIGFGNAFVSGDDIATSWRIDNFKVVDNSSAGSGGIVIIEHHLKQQGIM